MRASRFSQWPYDIIRAARFRYFSGWAVRIADSSEYRATFPHDGSGTFTAQKEMVVYFSAKYMSCDFDGLQIVGTQNTFVAGRIGMYNHYNDEGKLHRFRAVKEPSTSTSW